MVAHGAIRLGGEYQLARGRGYPTDNRDKCLGPSEAIAQSGKRLTVEDYVHPRQKYFGI